MGEGKIELMEELLSKVKQIDSQQQIVMKHMAELQAMLNSAGLDQMSDRMSGAFTEGAATEETIKSISKDIEMELNRLKNEAA